MPANTHTSPQDLEVRDDSADLRAALARAQSIMAEIASGDYHVRFPSELTKLAADHQLGALCHDINTVLDAFASLRQNLGGYREVLEQRLATIELQNAVLRELSAPMIEVARSVLCLPLVGHLDRERSRHITSTLLHTISQRAVRCVILDMSCIEQVDGATTADFVTMVRAVRLLGAACVLTGIRPALAIALVEAGLDLGEIETLRSPHEALQRYLTGK